MIARIYVSIDTFRHFYERRMKYVSLCRNDLDLVKVDNRRLGECSDSLHPTLSSGSTMRMAYGASFRPPVRDLGSPVGAISAFSPGMVGYKGIYCWILIPCSDGEFCPQSP